MNKIVSNLTIQNFKSFKDSFENTKAVFWDDTKNQLIHPGEFGKYREILAKKWLEMYIPKRLDLSTGFVITSKGNISPQCDIIIYDVANTPKIENVDCQNFFPIETVAGVIEIKSNINSISELNGHLKKLSRIKTLRADVQDPRPYHKKMGDIYDLHKMPYDNVFTILICNKLDFNFEPSQINYEDIPPSHRHNLILSLTDGLINYRTSNGTPNLHISFISDVFHDYNMIKSSNSIELPNYVRQFLAAFDTLVTCTTLLNIEMGFYLFDDGEFIETVT